MDWDPQEPEGWNTSEPDPFETVARFATLHEMDFARGLLQSAGIECFCPEEGLLGATGGGYSYLVNARLQVRRSQAEDARAILNAPFVAPNQHDE